MARSNWTLPIVIEETGNPYNATNHQGFWTSAKPNQTNGIYNGEIVSLQTNATFGMNCLKYAAKLLDKVVGQLGLVPFEFPWRSLFLWTHLKLQTNIGSPHHSCKRTPHTFVRKEEGEHLLATNKSQERDSHTLQICCWTDCSQLR